MKQSYWYLALLLLCPFNSHAGFDDMLKGVITEQINNTKKSNVSLPGLNNSEIVSGLKQALGQGADVAIKTLGKKDGFLKNEAVKIAMPKSLRQIEKGLRSAGQTQLADQLIETMNRAAEKAIPETADIFSNTIQAMSVEDAVKILQGDNNAATQYFRKHSTDQLMQKMLPVVQQATGSTGVGAAYKTIMKQAAPVTDILGGFLGNTNVLDVDHYVTEQALNGLFHYIGIEEQKIRENPVARSTDLLKKVFAQ